MYSYITQAFSRCFRPREIYIEPGDLSETQIREQVECYLSKPIFSKINPVIAKKIAYLLSCDFRTAEPFLSKLVAICNRTEKLFPEYFSTNYEPSSYLGQAKASSQDLKTLFTELEQVAIIHSAKSAIPTDQELKDSTIRVAWGNPQRSKTVPGSTARKLIEQGWTTITASRNSIDSLDTNHCHVESDFTMNEGIINVFDTLRVILASNKNYSNIIIDVTHGPHAIDQAVAMNTGLCEFENQIASLHEEYPHLSVGYNVLSTQAAQSGQNKPLNFRSIFSGNQVYAAAKLEQEVRFAILSTKNPEAQKNLQEVLNKLHKLQSTSYLSAPAQLRSDWNQLDAKEKAYYAQQLEAIAEQWERTRNFYKDDLNLSIQSATVFASEGQEQMHQGKNLAGEIVWTCLDAGPFITSISQIAQESISSGTKLARFIAIS